MAGEPEQHQNARPFRRRWLGRWVGRLILWFLALSLSVLIIVGMVAVLAYHNLTALANLAVSRFAKPYRVEFGSVSVVGRDLIRLDEVQVRPPEPLAQAEDAPWVVLHGVDFRFDLGELSRERRFQAIVLRGPEIRIDDASLTVLGLAGGGEAGAAGEQAPPMDLAKLGRVADRIEVVGGKWVFDTSLAPRWEGKWDATVPAIDFSAADWLNLEPFSIRLDAIRVGEGGALGSIERVSVTGRLRSDLRGIEIAECAIDSPRLSVTPAWLPRPGEDPGRPAEEAPVRVSPGDRPEESREGGFETLVGVFSIREADIAVSGFDRPGEHPVFPDFRFGTRVDWRDLTLKGGRIHSPKVLQLVLDELVIGGTAPAGEQGKKPPLLRADRVSFAFDPEAALHRGRLESVEIETPRIFLSPEGFPVGAPPTPGGGGASSRDPVSGKARPAKPPGGPAAWEIGRLKISRGSAEARGWRWRDEPVPGIALDFDTELRGLSARWLEAEAPLPAEEQVLSMRGLRVEGAASDGEDLLRLGGLEARFRADALLRRSHLDSVRIDDPVIRLTDRHLPRWVLDWPAGGQAPPAGGPSPGDAASAAPPEERPVWSVGTLAVHKGAFSLDTQALGGALPKLDGSFALSALEPKGDGAPTAAERLHRLRLHGIRIRSALPAAASAPPTARPEPLGGLFPQDAPPPPRETPVQEDPAIDEGDVATVREISVDFSAVGIQRDRQVDRVEIKGGQLQVGEALQRLVNGPGRPSGEAVSPQPPVGGAPVPEPPKPSEPARPPRDEARPPGDQARAATPASPGRKREWRVGEVVVTESQVRFQALLPQIEGLEFGIETVLRGIPLSREGLLSQDQTQKVEIAGLEIRDPYDSFITVAFLPTIFVEFSLSGLLSQRIDKIDLLHPAIHVGQGLFWWVDYQRKHRKRNEGVAIGGPGASPVTGVEAGPGDWEIQEINAHFGKIVIAPTGQPIGMIPFPFSASTNLHQGEIALKLQIPREQQYVYQFPDFELDLFGLEGNIEFNVPVRQENNNLVQTFTLDRAVWKQHVAQKLYLSVTHDSNGVYGKFGGEAYEGYAEGQFNYYLNEVGKWDAWVAGSNMDMGPITKILAPENFLMDGKINAKLVSAGVGKELGETWGEVEPLTPGRVQVTKLEELIAGLPEGWSQLKRSVSRLGLETLKDFAYDTGRADLYFLNQDGWLRLDLEGPTGSRRLELYAHDWREKGSPGGAGEAAASGEASPPGPERAERPEAASGGPAGGAAGVDEAGGAPVPRAEPIRDPAARAHSGRALSRRRIGLAPR